MSTMFIENCGTTSSLVPFPIFSGAGAGDLAEWTLKHVRQHYFPLDVSYTFTLAVGSFETWRHNANSGFVSTCSSEITHQFVHISPASAELQFHFHREHSGQLSRPRCARVFNPSIDAFLIANPRGLNPLPNCPKARREIIHCPTALQDTEHIGRLNATLRLCGSRRNAREPTRTHHPSPTPRHIYAVEHFHYCSNYFR
jgi:hypothetical protein